MKKIFLSLLAAAMVLGGASGCAGGDDDAPARVSDLTYFDRSGGVIFNGRVTVGDTSGEPDTRILAWTTPGDDGWDGTASLYDVRYVRQQDLDKWGLTDGRAALLKRWKQARRLVNEPDPGDSERLGQLFLPRVFSAENVWFGMRTIDEIGQDSPISNIVGPIRVTPIFLPLPPAAGTSTPGFGEVVHWAGDPTGDGYADLLLGSPGLGIATIHRGRTTNKLVERVLNPYGVKVKRALTELPPTLTINGDAGADFGFAVSGLARVNDDRPFEFVVGAPGLAAGTTLGAGAVYLFRGSRDFPEVIDADSAFTTIYGTETGGRLGSALSSASNIAGDDTLNFMVGAPGVDGRGAAYVFRAGIKNPATAADAIVVIHGENPGDEFGAEVELIGDINGDGISDLAVGAPGHDNGADADAGAVYVFYGGNNGVINFSGISGQRVIDLAADAADVTILGTAAGRRFGQSITIGGNLADNGAAARDFAVGGVDNAYVFFGGDTDTTTPFPLTGLALSYNDVMAAARLSGPAASGFGRAVIGPGDLNRDNIDDLTVAVPGLEEVWVFYGPITDAATSTDKLSAPVAGVGFASGLASPGDINLDGFPDLVIAAPGSGRAYLSF